MIVSVLVLAYNHELYISSCIRSILKQKTNFNFEVLILYTNSSDRTEEEILNTIDKCKYARIVYLSKGDDFVKNVTNSLGLSSGKYMVFVDGDDYWTHSGKLQTQVDFLDQHVDFNGVFHDVSITTDNEVGQIEGQLSYYSEFKTFSQFNHYRKDYTCVDAINRSIIPPSTLLFRTSALKSQLNEIYSMEYSGGWMITLFLLKRSKFRYINEMWGVYRNHPNGITKKRGHHLFVRSNIWILKSILNDDFYKYYKWAIYKSIAREYEFLLSSQCLKDASKLSKIKIALQSLFYQLLSVSIDCIRIVRNQF